MKKEIVEFVRDTRPRKCCVCKKRIRKGEIIYKEFCNDYYDNYRRFYHIDCIVKTKQKVIDDIKNAHKKLKKESIIPKTKVEI